MPRYFFSIKNGEPFDDVDGLDLPDAEAVRREAMGFVRDLMRAQPERRDWSHWTVCVTDEAARPVLRMAFSEVA